MAASAKEVAQLRAELQNHKKAIGNLAVALDQTNKVLKGLIQKLMENPHVASILNSDSKDPAGVPVQPPATGNNENSGG